MNTKFSQENLSSAPVSYILVTGALGYIGSQMVYLLNSMGLNTIALDKKCCDSDDKYPFVKYEQMDITDEASLEQLFSKYKIQSVIHFAGEISVTDSITDPQLYFCVNTMGTLNLLNVMKKFSCKEFIFSSTAAVYGNPMTSVIAEDHPTQPINPYGQSKLMVEKILESYRQAYQMNYICLRYFNAAGANLQANIGEMHDPETHVIPLFLDAAEGRRDHVSIFGTSYNTYDGTCIRDYIHIKDLSDAHYKALLWLQQGQQSGIFNLGSGRGVSVKELASRIEKITGKSLPVVLAEKRPGDPAILVANIDKAKKLLAWEPQHSAIEEIVEDAWVFMRKRIEEGICEH